MALKKQFRIPVFGVRFIYTIQIQETDLGCNAYCLPHKRKSKRKDKYYEKNQIYDLAFLSVIVLTLNKNFCCIGRDNANRASASTQINAD